MCTGETSRQAGRRAGRQIVVMQIYAETTGKPVSKFSFPPHIEKTDSVQIGETGASRGTHRMYVCTPSRQKGRRVAGNLSDYLTMYVVTT